MVYLTSTIKVLLFKQHVASIFNLRRRRHWTKWHTVPPLTLPVSCNNMVNLSLYSIKAVLLLDAEGNRVLAKYYGSDYTNLKEQKAFEKGLYDKTKRAQGTLTCYSPSDDHPVMGLRLIECYY